MKATAATLSILALVLGGLPLFQRRRASCDCQCGRQERPGAGGENCSKKPRARRHHAGKCPLMILTPVRETAFGQ